MRLARPITDDLSPVANWLVIIVLLFPVGVCLVLLERTNYGSWSAMLAVAGMWMASCVSALFWEQSRVLRCLPPIYGSVLMVGSQVVSGNSDWLHLLEVAGAGLAVGFAVLFAIWIEIRETLSDGKPPSA